MFSHWKEEEEEGWNPRLAFSRRNDLTCLNFADCLVGVWRVIGNCLEGVWQVSGMCLEGVLRVSKRCLEGVLKAGWYFPREPSNFVRRKFSKSQEILKNKLRLKLCQAQV